jgi:hypothetical protein
MSNNNQRRSDNGKESEAINQADKPGSNYDVGYGRPPDEFNFKPSQSGNPAGRPKASFSFMPELIDELGQLTADNHRQRITKKALVQAAVAGNLKVAMALIGLSATSGRNEADLSAADEDAFVEILVRGEARGDRDNSASATSAHKPESANDQ